MKMLGSYLFAAACTATMAATGGTGPLWTIIDAALVTGIVCGMSMAPWIMNHPSTK